MNAVTAKLSELKVTPAPVVPCTLEAESTGNGSQLHDGLELTHGQRRKKCSRRSCPNMPSNVVDGAAVDAPRTVPATAQVTWASSTLSSSTSSSTTLSSSTSSSSSLGESVMPHNRRARSALTRRQRLLAAHSGEEEEEETFQDLCMHVSQQAMARRDERMAILRTTPGSPSLTRSHSMSL
eukprot:m.9583 g.9583  ORF g.9583 m.9583 type:complete len:181 (-) comp5469_c0_seq1:1535-2077(-)